MRYDHHKAAGIVLLSALLAACAQASRNIPPSSPAAPAGSSIAAAPLTASQAEWVEHTLRALSLRDKIAQMVVIWVDGSFLPEGSTEYERLRALVQDQKVGGIVISVGPPLEIAAKLNTLQRLAPLPLLVAADVERSPGQRLAASYMLPYAMQSPGATEFPPIMAIGATGDEHLAYEVGRITAQEVRAAGVHMAYAPVVDVNINPANPIINTRSYGEDPKLVARLAAAQIRGFQEHGVFATAKHFPGHGDTQLDSHLQLNILEITRARADSVELVPFRAAVAAGVSSVMVAHVAFPLLTGDSVPATISPVLETNLLRGEMGFRGLIISDALDMDAIAARWPGGIAAVRAIQSGTDIVLMPRDVRVVLDAVEAAVRDGDLTEARIDESVRRILEAKARAGLIERRTINLDDVQRFVARPENAAVARELAQKSIVLVRDSAHIFPLAKPASGRILSITYTADLDPFVGRTLQRELAMRYGPIATKFTDDRTRPEELDSLLASIGPDDVVLFSAFIRVVARRGSIAMPEPIGNFLNAAAARSRLALFAFGNPYLLLQYPNVQTYALGWGSEDISQTAMVRALAGEAPITGKLPISLPPYHKAGEGISLAAGAQ